jgi:hypothetical protein
VLRVFIESKPRMTTPTVQVINGTIYVDVPERNDDVAEAMDAAQAVIRHFYERPD